MACEVKTYGKIRDFVKVQEYFGLKHDDNWLNTVNTAMSPTGEIICLAQGEKLALLSSFWDNKTQESSYGLSFCSELDDPNQIITSILCLPIYGKNASSGPEWTVCALGLNTGMVIFYTDNGMKLFSQTYQDDPVLSIKAYTPPRHSESDSSVYIIYDQCVCIIKGANIFPLLSNLRHNLNRTIGRNTNATPLETDDMITYQKYMFSRERDTIINDAAVVCAQRPCTFDHIVEDVLGCGYYAKISENPVQRSSILGVGAEPYLGFYYAEEGYKTISLTEVAKDVIGIAYKNILGNLFRRAPEPTTPEEPPSPAKEAQMRNRCRLYDGKRDGFTIAIAPGANLAVVTDNLDRVMLVDVKRATVLRIWKGYRDAQCAFMPVKEKTLKGVSTNRRKALFLIIYAPRLGCLEIWALQNGPKIAAFTVSKSGQLGYHNHGLMGVPPGAKVKAPINYCLFLDPSDASVKEIQIPFHFALSETNSKTSRDIHLLRRLKNLLRDTTNLENVEDIAKLAGEFQTVEVRQQCMEVLRKNRQIKPQVFKTVISAFETTLDEDMEKTEDDINFLNLIRNYKRLVDFYISMKWPQSAEFDETLELSDSDLVVINQLVLLLSKHANVPGKVTFQEHCRDDGDFVDFLSVFKVDQADSIRIDRAKMESLGYISGKLLAEFFEHGLSFDQFKMEAKKTGIPSADLLMLALYYWLEKPFTYGNCDEVINDMSHLAAMIRAICELEGDQINDYAYNAISPWWQEVREMLLESPKSLGLLVAIVCKTVAAELRRNYREGSCDDSPPTEPEERWEQISHDEAQWGLLIGKLEDVAILGAILEFPIISSEPTMPELPYETPDCSLKFIVNGGKGIVTDLTAQWLINSRIHPKKILEKQIVKPQAVQTSEIKDIQSTTGDVNESESTETIKESNTINDPVLEKLSLLRDHFPFSLESGVVLTLMSWQYMVHWSKNLQSLEFLSAALTCLEQFKTEDLALKHGVCCMLWNATLKYPLQSTMKLIQKVGRLPKDKMCQQDIEMPASLVPDFLELAISFLDHFNTSLDHEKRDLKFEESLADGQLPIQFIALQQHNAIKELLKLHQELCTVLHFIAAFQLKIHKPITTLFSAMSNKAFFVDINKELSFVLPQPDLALQQQREEFLCTVISASMDLIREDLEQLFVVEHLQYMEKVNALADSWKLEKTGLRRRQIIEMYAHGYDTHAEMLMGDLNEDEEVGRVLLEVAGNRLNLYTKSSQAAYLKIASVGQQLLQYLDNLRDAPNKFMQITASDPDEINIVALSKLITNVFECLSRRESKYLHIAAQMFDACSLLQE